MGIQQTEGGNIDWSKELPPTCRLSSGLKLLITPIFSRLLESNPDRVWNFDSFFKEVDGIVRKKIINVFCPHTWNTLKVYISGESNLTRLQELIAQQTDIQHCNQLLIFDGQLLQENVQPMLPISNYPEGITEHNPVICYSKYLDDTGRFPKAVIKDFPKFTSSFTIEDYAISKMCSAISCYILKEVTIYNQKQELIRRSVQLYVHELYHECSHLVDYHIFLEKNCYSTIKWKDNFLRTFKREMTMMQLLVKQSGQEDTQLTNIVTKMENFHASCRQEISEMSNQIKQLNDEVASHIIALKDDHIQRKLLKKQWNNCVGCTCEDRCIAKVQVVVDQILKIKAQFYEDRKRPNLNFNEEQIHKYEKNKLSENCIKVKSLFFDHCYAGATDQFARFHSWYKMGLDVRRQSEIIENKLLQLAEMLENFVSELNTHCLKYNDELERYIHNIKERIREKEFISLRSEINVDHNRQGSSTQGGQSSSLVTSQLADKNHHRQHLIKEVLNGLMENQKSVLDMKKELDTNTDILNRFSVVLRNDSNKLSLDQDF